MTFHYRSFASSLNYRGDWTLGRAGFAAWMLSLPGSRLFSALARKAHFCLALAKSLPLDTAGGRSRVLEIQSEPTDVLGVGLPL